MRSFASQATLYGVMFGVGERQSAGGTEPAGNAMALSEQENGAAAPATTVRWLRPLLTERARPAFVRDHPAGWRLAVGTVCFGAFMGQLDASVVTLAYPALRSGFHATLAGVEWVSLAYLLALAALLVPVGRLSDAYGRKLMYLYGFLVFTGASAACGLATGLAMLIVMRTLQAVGAALLQANSVALVTTSAPPGRMRAALGMQAGAQALGLALGPTLGGILVATVGWRWIFLINVPIGVLALPAGHYLLPRTRTHAPTGRFDYPGLGFSAAASTLLLLGISAASGLNLPWWGIGSCFAAALAAGFAFTRRIRRARNPLVDPVLLRSRQISTGLAGALGGYLVLFGPLVLIPVVLTARGASLTSAGLASSALPVGFAAAALAGERFLPADLSDRSRGLGGGGSRVYGPDRAGGSTARSAGDSPRAGPDGPRAGNLHAREQRPRDVRDTDYRGRHGRRTGEYDACHGHGTRGRSRDACAARGRFERSTARRTPRRRAARSGCCGDLWSDCPAAPGVSSARRA